MPPEKFAEYLAMDQLLPFGDEKLCWVLAVGFAAIHSRLNTLASSWGAKDLPELNPRDFIPWKKKAKQKGYTNPNAAAAAFRASMGR